MIKYHILMLRLRIKWRIHELKKTTIGHKVKWKYRRFRVRYLPDWERKVSNPIWRYQK